MTSRPPTLLLAALGAAGVLAGCANAAADSVLVHQAAFTLAVLDLKGAAAVAVASPPPSAGPVAPPGDPIHPATPIPAPLETAPPPVVSGGGSTSGGGASGGAPELALPATVTLLDSAARPDGTASWTPGLAGTVELLLADDVPSTTVLPPGNPVTTLHPRPVATDPAPTGRTTIQGSLGPAGHGLVVSYRSRHLKSFYGVAADAAGDFSFPIPVDGTDSGYVMAAAVSDAPAFAIKAVSPAQNVPLMVTGLLPAPPDGPGLVAPAPPDGMSGGVARLCALDGADRLDLIAFSVPAVPRYALGTPTLASVFEAASPGGASGSEVIAGASVPAFLPAPDLSGLGPRLAPGGVLAWPAVPGASLYTLELHQQGGGSSLWEGASPYAKITLPAAIAPDLAHLTLTVTAWAAPDVSIYSVAGLAGPRGLRVPATSSAANSQRSWTQRAGLGT